MLYKCLPYSIFKTLFGDRKKWGLKTNHQDEDFIKWQDNYYQFYNDNQKGKIGNVINHYGFKLMRQVNLENLTALEVGPGIIEHTVYWNHEPETYIIADINKTFLKESAAKLKNISIKSIIELKVEDTHIPLEDNSVDIIISFHQLEHIYKLDDYVQELKRILKPNGILVGAVPTEGSIAWGLGRWLTSMRYVNAQMNFNYNKIICWEHPNFVNTIKMNLDKYFTREYSKKKPFSFLPMDFNFSWSFIYRNTNL